MPIVYRFAIQITWIFFLFGWYSTCFPSSVLEKQDIRKTITRNFFANRLFEGNWDQVCPNGNGFVQGRTTLFVFRFKRVLQESCLREIEKKVSFLVSAKTSEHFTDRKTGVLMVIFTLSASDKVLIISFWGRINQFKVSSLNFN